MPLTPSCSTLAHHCADITSFEATLPLYSASEAPDCDRDQRQRVETTLLKELDELKAADLHVVAEQ
jgi:hypothetical protein